MTDFARRMYRLEELAEDERHRRDAEKLAAAYDLPFGEALDWRQEAKRLEDAHRAGGASVPSYAELAAARGITLDELMAEAEVVKQVLGWR